MKTVGILALAACCGTVWGGTGPCLEILTEGKVETGRFVRGAKLFTDRTYRLATPPAALADKRFAAVPIDGGLVRCTSAGRLYALAPANPERKNHGVGVSLVRQGFAPATDIASFQLFGTNDYERVDAFCRDVKAGDRFLFGKWAVLVGVEKAEGRRPKAEDWSKNCGETLYNGIRLPKEWPPQRLNTPSRRPIEVPYLKHPPKVINIDVGRQLFVDDFLIESTDLLRLYKLPRKFEGNPVLKPEGPVEKQAGMVGGCSRPCVWYDADKGLYRLYYIGGTYYRGAVCLATSKDCIHWDRTPLDVNPGTNQVWPHGFQSDSWSIVPDPFAADPARHWRLFATNPGGVLPAWIFSSPDGVHWSEKTQVGETEDRATMFFNPFRRKWVYSIKKGFGGHGRSRAYQEGDSLEACKDWNFDALGPWLYADEQDVPEPGYGHMPQLYNFDSVAYESLMLGFFEIHRGPENGFCEPRGLPKLNEITFGYSRDGYHYYRPDRRAHLPASREDTWDRGFVETCGNACVLSPDGNSLYFFHSGCRGNPAMTSDPKWMSMYDDNAIGFSILRRDGFCALHAGGSVASVTTRPVVFGGRHLFVNADCREGTCFAEVLDADGRPLEGFAAADCAAVSCDSTKVELKFPQNLASLAGRPVRFRFSLRQGSLYSFWVSAKPTGESGGYLAGGGPGHRGLVD